MIKEENAPCDPRGITKFPLAVPWGFNSLGETIKCRKSYLLG